MKPIDKDELYEHLSGFLKNRGVEIKPGTATKGIQTGCTFLAEAINRSQAGIQLARAEVEKKLEQMRQTVDEKLQGTLEQRLGASFKMVTIP